MMEPEVLADFVVDGLREEKFLILPHPEVLEYMRRKTADYDRWIGGMNRLMQRLTAVDASMTPTGEQPVTERTSTRSHA